ncbi:TniB family NTP-binding protein [bacterium]|nr:TniB family NTP-binding protein [bacterium]MCI0606636.1 TniB family NTP-binding protein [bacterium]
MKKERAFPLELLKLPVQKRLKYFQDYVAAHHLLISLFDELRNTILLPAGTSILAVVGPTGVGKTFLRKLIEAEIHEEWSRMQQADPEWDRGRIPVVSTEVIARDKLQFSWNGYYERVLRALYEPLIDQKIEIKSVKPDLHGLVTSFRSMSGNKLRFALESALLHRKPFAVFVDEAQHLVRSGGYKLQDQMDCIKSIANTTGVLHVLMGTYEMVDLLDLSDQLIRRTLPLHFPRYRERTTDLRMFANVIYSFQQKMPLPLEPNLIEHRNFLYERSVGCVGILKDWLMRSLNRVLRNDSKTMTVKDLEATVILSKERGSKMRQRIEQEERAFEKFLQTEPKSHQYDDEPPPPKTKPINRRPGRRKPGRDPIGKAV